jgi:VCBS repeat-containing protein
VDDPPTLDPINSLSIPEDAPLQTVFLSGISSGASNELQTLRVSAVSGNLALIRDPTVIYASANTTGRLQFAPLPDANGNATITVSVSDGVSTNSRSFNVTVTPVNDPPVISSITNREIAEDTTASIQFSVYDLETAPDQLILQVSSSNLELVDETGLSITGAGTNRTLRVTPLPDQSGGFSTITITVTDGSNAMATANFDLTIRPVNDPPTIAGLADLTISKDSGPVPVNFTISDPESLPSSLAVAAVSSNQVLVPDANILLTGEGANRTLTFTPTSHATGAVVITVRVMDDGSGGGTTNQASGAFTVRVVDASLALQIEHVGSNAVISWTTNNSMAWTLQSTTNVASPGSWNNAGQTPVVTGDRYVVTNAVNGAARFYRLTKQ